MREGARAPLALQLLLQVIHHRWPTRIHALVPEGPFQTAMVYLGTILCISVPIKIWNDARIEHRVREQEKLLMKARIDALTNQINPHFLFNTLASISSLVRTKPEAARTLILKLSSMLRRRLRHDEPFVTLREELASVDEYLDIEAVRFGAQLRIEKAISPDTLDGTVPSMILQPLVENSIRHGLAPKVGGGRIILRSRRVTNLLDRLLGRLRRDTGSIRNGAGGPAHRVFLHSGLNFSSSSRGSGPPEPHGT